MSLALMLALQASAPAEAAMAQPPLVAPIAFDLARLQQAGGSPAGRRCRSDDPVPIVVCARRPADGDYPMAEWARVFAPRPLRAELDMGGGATLGFHTQAAEIAPGMVSNRVMFGLRMPF